MDEIGSRSDSSQLSKLAGESDWVPEQPARRGARQIKREADHGYAVDLLVAGKLRWVAVHDDRHLVPATQVFLRQLESQLLDASRGRERTRSAPATSAWENSTAVTRAWSNRVFDPVCPASPHTCS